MADLSLPADLYPQVAAFGLRQSTVQTRSRFTAELQVGDLMAERWEASITWPPRRSALSGSMEVLQNQLAGGLHYLLLHHPARSTPRGTLRGTPTLQASVARGAKQLVLNAAAGSTLLVGDMVGVAGQLFQVAANCAEVSGTLTVPTVNRVRTTLTLGAAVAWNRPAARFVCPALINPTVHRPGYAEGGALDLEEVID